MSYLYPDYKLGAGWNNPSPVSIESITPMGGTAFEAPRGIGQYNPGKRVLLANFTEYVSGFPYAYWEWNFITRVQFDYLQSTYCGGGYSGLVTVKTRVGNSASYDTFNATMLLPDPDKTKPEWPDRIVDYRVMFIGLQ